MNNGVIFMSMILPILVIFIMGLIMPEVTRKEIFFGVRIPFDKARDEALNSFKTKYYRDYLITCGIFTIVLIFLVLNYFENPIIYVSGVFIMIGLSSLIYFRTHLRVKAFKQTQGWTIGKKETLVVDTNFRGERNTKILVSPLWFLIPISLIAFNMVLGFVNYESLPDKIPMHYNIMGEVDRWADKSMGIVFQLPIIELFVTGIMYFTYKQMGWVKQQINSSNPEESLYQNRMFRRKWSAYTIFMNTCVVIIFTIINLNAMQIINLKGIALSLILGGITVFILLGTIALSLYTGQGGSRIRMPVKGEENPGLIDREDDRHWKLGMFYFNPNDPALWVEKRFGVGFTVNFGRPIGIVIMVGILATAFLLPLIMRLLE